MDDYNLSNSSLDIILEYCVVSDPTCLPPLLFFGILILFGTFGNGLVIVAFYVHPPLRAHSINVYMVHTSAVNLVISTVVNPAYITTFFIRITGLKMFIVVDCVSLTVMHLANVLSMYSLCAVATNRYLLITRPKTTFRTWCVPRNRIACVLVGLWLAAVVTAVPYWISLLLIALIEIHYGVDNDSIERLVVLRKVLLALWFLPIIIVPTIHFFTLRAIKVHRKIMDLQASVETNNSAVSQPNQSSGPNQNNAMNHSTRSAVKDEQNSTASGRLAEDIGAGNANINRRNSHEKNESGEQLHPLSCCLGLRHKVAEVPDMKNGVAASEVRLVKMMILMYTVLLISVVPSILSIEPLDGTEVGIWLRIFAFLIPIYPAAMPYIFLWSNKKFRSASGMVIQKVRNKIIFQQRVGL